MNIKSTTGFRAAQSQERDEVPSEFGVRPGVFSRTMGRMKRHQGAGRGNLQDKGAELLRGRNSGSGVDLRFD